MASAKWWKPKGCSAPTSWPSASARHSGVHTTSTFPLPKMSLDHALEGFRPYFLLRKTSPGRRSLRLCFAGDERVDSNETGLVGGNEPWAYGPAGATEDKRGS